MTLLRRTLAVAVIGTLAAVGLLVAPSVAGTPTTYHLSDSGRTVTVVKGHLIRITLRTASDGGYGWVVTHGRHSTTFKIVSRAVTQSNPPGTVGGYSVTTYTLRATARGTDTFRAIERRSFDKTDVIRRFALHITVVRR